MQAYQTVEDVYEAILPKWEERKKRYPKELNLEGLEPALATDVAEIVLGMIQAREEWLRGEIEKMPSLGRSTEETPISKQDVLSLLTPTT